MSELSAAGYPAPVARPLRDWKRSKELAKLSRAFEYLESNKFEDKPAGKYPIDGDNMWALVIELTTAGGAGNFEAHKDYIDIHHLVRGAEMIGSAPLAGLITSKPYDKKSEAELFELPKQYKHIDIAPGEFIIFFPGQAHLPGRERNGSQKIKKVVIKALASAVMT
ncbi:MAG: YhcH/YjgK/YiaL family protein [Bryobacteraceae bacterium]